MLYIIMYVCSYAIAYIAMAFNKVHAHHMYLHVNSNESQSYPLTIWEHMMYSILLRDSTFE